MRAFLGLGSNVGDREKNLRHALSGLRDLVRVSSVYESAPVGGPPQDDYLNMVAELDTALTAPELLALAQRLEEAAGRVRTVRWGPRTLDVDVLLVEGVAVDEPDLVVPHPRMWQRRFVLEPLAELAPDLVSAEARIAAGGEVRAIGMLSGY
ncbi:MAG TPA: 2-amino-4-hydroxy-6-hydroxymethyldihydropteridine diphosphokinase [Acidimicrobiales bacterium]|nr:2-amino-4-hydroxy-6-hydroxymethyldihydropteridine diphosphokinase [Acidimicrobiales bacterium]